MKYIMVPWKIFLWVCVISDVSEWVHWNLLKEELINIEIVFCKYYFHIK